MISICKDLISRFLSRRLDQKALRSNLLKPSNSSWQTATDKQFLFFWSLLRNYSVPFITIVRFVTVSLKDKPALLLKNVNLNWQIVPQLQNCFTKNSLNRFESSQQIHQGGQLSPIRLAKNANNVCSRSILCEFLSQFCFKHQNNNEAFHSWES